MYPAGHSGNQSAHLVAVHAHRFREPFPYAQVILASRNIAALQSDLVAFKLTGEMVSLLGISTLAVDVLISVQAEHLWRRREREAREIIEAIPKAVSRIQYIGGRDANARVIRTIVGAASNHSLLRCIVKFVPAQSARSGTDEAWLLTAYFLGQTELRRLLRRKDVRPV
jgi:hypothetical protein